MKMFCQTLFALGLTSYVISLVYAGTMRGEIFSDTGDALMLIVAVLLLFRLQRTVGLGGVK